MNLIKIVMNIISYAEMLVGQLPTLPYRFRRPCATAVDVGCGYRTKVALTIYVEVVRLFFEATQNGFDVRKTTL